MDNMDLKKSLQKPLVLIAVVFVVIVLAAGIGYAISQKNGKNDAANSKKPASQETSIRLLGKTANPDIVTVKAGSYVQFNSADGGKHNIALEHAAVQHNDDKEYHSGDFEKDEAWRVQFKKDGTYTFRDEFNPEVKIRVVVYTEGKDYKIQ